MRGRKIQEFKVNGQKFAIPFPFLDGIEKTGRIKQIPGAPKFVEGSIGSNNNETYVYNMRGIFGFPVTEMRAKSHLLTIHTSKSRIAVLADEVGDTRLYQKDDIIIREILLSEEDHIIGLFILKDGTMLISDPDKFFVTSHVEKLAETFEKQMIHDQLLDQISGAN